MVINECATPLVELNGEVLDAMFIEGKNVLLGTGFKEYTSPGNYSVELPPGKIRYCIIGGGGSGAAGSQASGESAGGGHAGTILSGTISVSSGQLLNIVVGAGGAGIPESQNGRAGGESSIDDIVAPGGNGGSLNSHNYNGIGGEKTNCMGTFFDGSAKGDSRGGEAGFANGGDESNPTPIRGAGAGGTLTYWTGNGGNGVVYFEWGNYHGMQNG